MVLRMCFLLTICTYNIVIMQNLFNTYVLFRVSELIVALLKLKPAVYLYASQKCSMHVCICGRSISACVFLWSTQYIPMVSLHPLPPSVEHTVCTYGLTPPSPSLCGAHSMYLCSHSTLSLPLWSTQYIPMVSLHPLPPSVEHTVRTYGLTPPSPSLCGAHSMYLWSHSTLSLPLWSTQYVPMVSLHPLSSSVGWRKGW